MLSFLILLLRLVMLVAERSGHKEVAANALNEIEILQGNRVRRASDARDSVQPGGTDKYKRD